MRPGAGEVGGSGRGRRKPGPAAPRPAPLLLLLAATAAGAAGGAADVGRGFLGPGGEGEEVGGGWGPPAEAAALADFGARATRALEEAFARNPQPMLQELQAIATEAGVTAKQALQWFHGKQDHPAPWDPAKDGEELGWFGNLQAYPGEEAGAGAGAGAGAAAARAGQEPQPKKRCTASRECGAVKVCVDGACECPVLYGGNRKCTQVTRFPKGLGKRYGGWCAVAMTSPKFKKFSDSRKRLADYRPRALRPGFLQTERALKGMKNQFGTCAVVGSSGKLKRAQLGEAIDAHDAVIRFNGAPSRGHTKYAGSKTTLRIQNIVYCGYSEYPGERCIHYSANLGPRHQCKHWRRCRKVQLSKPGKLYVTGYWKAARRPPLRDPGKRDAKLSAGFYGVLLALQVCGKVDLYGFGSSNNFYYRKKSSGKWKNKPFRTRHKWKYEGACVKALPRLFPGKVAVHAS